MWILKQNCKSLLQEHTFQMIGGHESHHIQKPKSMFQDSFSNYIFKTLENSQFL